MSGPYDVLIVGCGAIAGGYDAARPDDARPLTHAAAYRCHGGFRLRGCVDPDDGLRTAFAARWGVEANFPTMEAALAHARYDVVSICSPTSLHADHLDAVFAARPRLVFAEKPLTASLAESERRVSGFEAAGVLLAVNHTRRWAPDMVRLRKELAGRRWGAVRAAAGTYNKGALNNGAHMIDLLHFLLGPVELVAAGRPLWDFWPKDPSVPALLDAGGIPIVLGLAHAMDYALFELSVVCEQAVITMEDGGGRWRLRPAVDSPTFPGYRALQTGDWRDGEYGEAMLGAVTQIHAALATGAPLSSTGRTAVQAQAVCTAMIEASLVHEER